MGLLDDAIREHLDLKRRRGGDPVEIEREEQEALGPVRRGPEGAEPEPLPDSDLEAEEQHGLEPELEPESEWDERYAEDVEAPAPAEHLREPESALPEHGGQDTAEYDVTGDLNHHRELERDRGLEPLERDHGLEHEDARESEPAPEHGRSEDPLEETPEFLQDTPEHDRLWFEQKPPKDFDFEE